MIPSLKKSTVKKPKTFQMSFTIHKVNSSKWESELSFPTYQKFLSSVTTRKKNSLCVLILLGNTISFATVDQILDKVIFQNYDRKVFVFTFSLWISADELFVHFLNRLLYHSKTNLTLNLSGPAERERPAPRVCLNSLPFVLRIPRLPALRGSHLLPPKPRQGSLIVSQISLKSPSPLIYPTFLPKRQFHVSKKSPKLNLIQKTQN